jgi:hypothetical protein
MKAQQRPTMILVMAILNIVFGGFGLMGSLCGGAFTLIFMNLDLPFGGQGNPVREMYSLLEQRIPGYTVIMASYFVLHALLGTALIIAGIGLIRMKTWARWTSIAYSLITIVVTIANSAFTVMYVNPIMQEWSERFMRSQRPGTPNFTTNSTFNNIGSLVGTVVNCSYAVALLVVMFLPSVSAALAGAANRSKEDADGDADSLHTG